MLLAIKHYVLIRITIFFKGKNPTQPPPCFSEEEKTHSFIHWQIQWCMAQNVSLCCLPNFYYMHEACYKPEVSSVCCWRGVCAFICLSFESKVYLFIKHEPWHLKIPHRKSSPWGQPTSTSVKLNAVTNASNYPPLLMSVKGLFVPMLVLTKLICFSECWSADLLVFLSVLEQESSRHKPAQRKAKWHFFLTTNSWHRTDVQERLQWGLLRVWSLH